MTRPPAPGDQAPSPWHLGLQVHPDQGLKLVQNNLLSSIYRSSKTCNSDLFYKFVAVSVWSLSIGGGGLTRFQGELGILTAAYVMKWAIWQDEGAVAKICQQAACLVRLCRSCHRCSVLTVFIRHFSSGRVVQGTDTPLNQVFIVVCTLSYICTLLHVL